MTQPPANINYAYRALRRTIGFMGIFLPWALMAWTRTIEPSISHYYYTSASPIFTGVLISFGLMLITYTGHQKKNDEVISDNIITTFAGIFAIATALIPTECHKLQIHTLCHNNSDQGTMHLLFAGAFLALVGAMSYFKFPLGGKHVSFYKWMGKIVWISILLMVLYFALISFNVIDEDAFPTGVLIGEIIGVTAFGIAWLVKGRPEEMAIVQKVK